MERWGYTGDGTPGAGMSERWTSDDWRIARAMAIGAIVLVLLWLVS